MTRGRMTIKELMKSRMSILRGIKNTNQKGEMNDLVQELDLVNDRIKRLKRK